MTLLLLLTLLVPLPAVDAEARGDWHQQELWAGLGPAEQVDGGDGSLPTGSSGRFDSGTLALHGSAAGFDSSTVHYSPELWRAYIEAEFPGEVEYVEAVMDCESGGNPDALGWAANEIGLMQINPGPWSYLWTEPGQPFYGLDPWEPAVNVEIAKTIRDTRRGWAHWTCARIIGLP